MTRVRQALLLILPLLRTTAWPAVAAAAVPGLATFSLDGPPQACDPARRRRVMRGCSVHARRCRGADCGGRADALALRRMLRVALALGVVSVFWPLLLVQDGVVPDSGATLELGAMLSATLAVAAFVGGRHPNGRGGLTAAVALLAALAAAAIALPEPWPLFAAGRSDPHWDAALERWAAVLVLGALALVYASLDPARSPSGRGFAACMNRFGARTRQMRRRRPTPRSKQERSGRLRCECRNAR